MGECGYKIMCIMYDVQKAEFWPLFLFWRREVTLFGLAFKMSWVLLFLLLLFFIVVAFYWILGYLLFCWSPGRLGYCSSAAANGIWMNELAAWNKFVNEKLYMNIWFYGLTILVESRNKKYKRKFRAKPWKRHYPSCFLEGGTRRSRAQPSLCASARHGQ